MWLQCLNSDNLHRRLAWVPQPPSPSLLKSRCCSHSPVTPFFMVTPWGHGENLEGKMQRQGYFQGSGSSCLEPENHHGWKMKFWDVLFSIFSGNYILYYVLGRVVTIVSSVCWKLHSIRHGFFAVASWWFQNLCSLSVEGFSYEFFIGKHRFHAVTQIEMCVASYLRLGVDVGWYHKKTGWKPPKFNSKSPWNMGAKEDDPASCLGFGYFSGSKLLNFRREIAHSDESTLMIGFPSTRARETGVSAWTKIWIKHQYQQRLFFLNSKEITKRCCQRESFNLPCGPKDLGDTSKHIALTWLRNVSFFKFHDFGHIST